MPYPPCGARRYASLPRALLRFFQKMDEFYSKSDSGRGRRYGIYLPLLPFLLKKSLMIMLGLNA